MTTAAKTTAQRTSCLRKLRRRALLPAGTVLARLSPDDARLLRQALTEPLECVYDPCFRRAGAEALVMRPLPGEEEAVLPEDVMGHAGGDSPSELLLPRRHRVLTAAEERELFLRFNYCRYRIMLVVRRHLGRRLGLRAALAVIQWMREALATRNAIVRLNTSLVMAMARRTKTAGVELGDLISEGNLALLRCVDKFDCARGFKFSTYACRAIMSSFARLGGKAARHRLQFPATFDPTLEKSDHLEAQRQDTAGECIRGLKVILADNVAALSTVERSVITARFALDRPEAGGRRRRGPTLEQVGASLGVSKERVRQIQNRALRKLRTVMEEYVLAAS